MTALRRAPDTDTAAPATPAANRLSSARVESSSPTTALADQLRAVLPTLCAEILAEVQGRVEHYACEPDSVTMHSIHSAVAQAVAYFVARLADPAEPRAELDDTMRRIGRGEAFEGRNLDSLHAAFSIGANLAWRQIRGLAVQSGSPRSTLPVIGDELFEFMSSLACQAELGYRHAQAQLVDATHRWQERLVELVLGGATSRAQLRDEASVGNWAVPDSVVVVAIEPGVGPFPRSAALPPDVLGRLVGSQPLLVVPAPVTSPRREELARTFAGHRIALGCEVELADAAASLRWARRTLELAAYGVLPGDAVLDAAEHIATLWVHSEPLLARIVRRTVLGPLTAEPQHSRRILTETLLAWITHSRPSAPALALVLGVHPQTVRYRLRRLRELFGDQLEDPNRVQEIQLALQSELPVHP